MCYKTKYYSDKCWKSKKWKGRPALNFFKSKETVMIESSFSCSQTHSATPILRVVSVREELKWKPGEPPTVNRAPIQIPNRLICLVLLILLTLMTPALCLHFLDCSTNPLIPSVIPYSHSLIWLIFNSFTLLPFLWYTSIPIYNHQLI